MYKDSNASFLLLLSLKLRSFVFYPILKKLIIVYFTYDIFIYDNKNN